MKILQVNNFHYPRGGSDRYFLDVTRLLRERGHDVRTFSTAHPANVEPSWLVSPPPMGVETERASGLRNLQHFLYSPEARRDIGKALAQFKPDIVHLHIYYGQLTASILGPLRQAGVPIVQTLHEYKLVCPTHGLYAQGRFCDACQGQRYWHAALKRCNRNSLARSLLSMAEAYLSNALGAKDVVDHFIAVSHYQKELLTRLGIQKESISVLHNFTETALEPPSERGQFFLFVGRVNQEKGIGILLDAYARLPAASPPLKVVGTGAGMARWREQAIRLGVDDRVEWLGCRTGRELAALYRQCLALINPSLLNETFGLTCLEALAQGRPVIASRVGALPEVVTEGEDGLIVEAGSPESLAKAMETFVVKSDQAQEMGRRGWMKVRARFSPGRHYQNVIMIYKSAIGPKH